MTTFTPAQITTLTPVASDHAHAYRHSVPTLAAIGFLAYYVVTMCHEVLGHGVAFYMLGAHHFVLTSTSMDKVRFARSPPKAQKSGKSCVRIVR
jgi:hypothetical protein